MTCSESSGETTDILTTRHSLGPVTPVTVRVRQARQAEGNRRAGAHRARSQSVRAEHQERARLCRRHDHARPRLERRRVFGPPREGLRAHLRPRNSVLATPSSLTRTYESTDINISLIQRTRVYYGYYGYYGFVNAPTGAVVTKSVPINTNISRGRIQHLRSSISREISTGRKAARAQPITFTLGSGMK